MLVINESTVQNTEAGRAAVILDLDGFVEAEMPVDLEMWNLVEDLHVKVENAFEASITDGLRELIR